VKRNPWTYKASDESHTMRWKTQKEKDWLHALVHESGHAIIASLKEITCHGVFLKQFPLKASVLVNPLPQPSAMSNDLRLYLAAGSAAEKTVFGEADLEGSGADRLLFGEPQGTTFDEKVTEAEAILSDKKPQIERLAARLHEIVEGANGDFNGFPIQQVNQPGSAATEDFWVLLNKSELAEEIGSEGTIGSNLRFT
jgi:hypothetical protein